MSRALRVNGTMDEELLRRMDAYAEQQHYEDRSTALRQLVDFALRELQKRETLDAYRSGRVTLRDFGRALGLTTWQAHDLLRAEGVAVARGDRTETAQALEAGKHSPAVGSCCGA